MGVSTPLICHACWPTKQNWNGPCQHGQALVDKLRAAERTLFEAGRATGAIAQERDALRAALAACVAALATYGKHQTGCRWFQTNLPNVCTCGFAATRARVERRG